MKTASSETKSLLVASILLILGVSALGCRGAGANADPTPTVETHIDAARGDVEAADGYLAKTPPKVPEARVELKEALENLDGATAANTVAGEEFRRVEAERVKAVERVTYLEKSFWSYRQKRLGFIIAALAVVLGVLAAIGNYAPGWWSWLPLGVIKVCRFVVFAGIPHLIQGVVWVVKKVGGLFSSRLPAASALSTAKENKA
jgi:hypothetical protein